MNGGSHKKNMKLLLNLTKNMGYQYFLRNRILSLRGECMFKNQQTSGLFIQPFTLSMKKNF